MFPKIKDETAFNTWTESINKKLDKFLNELPKDKSLKLNFTINSLNEIESILLEKYQNIEESLKDQEFDFLERCSIYIGETFRRNFGGKWSIRFETEKKYKDFIFSGLPILLGTSNVPICPLALATALIDRNKGDYLYQIAMKIGNKPKDH